MTERGIICYLIGIKHIKDKDRMTVTPRHLEELDSHEAHDAEPTQPVLQDTDPMAVFMAVRETLVGEAKAAALAEAARVEQERLEKERVEQERLEKIRLEQEARRAEQARVREEALRRREIRLAERRDSDEKRDWQDARHQEAVEQSRESQKDFRGTSEYVAARLGAPTSATAENGKFDLAWDIDTSREESFAEDAKPIVMNCRGRIVLSVESLPSNLRSAWAIVSGAKKPFVRAEAREQRARRMLTTYFTENAEQLGFSFAFGGEERGPTVLPYPRTPQPSDIRPDEQSVADRAALHTANEKGLRSVRGLAEILSGRTIPPANAAVPEQRRHEHDDLPEEVAAE